MIYYLIAYYITRYLIHHRALISLMKSLIPNLLFLFVILHGNSCDAQVESGGFISVLLKKLLVIPI